MQSIAQEDTDPVESAAPSSCGGNNFETFFSKQPQRELKRPVPTPRRPVMMDVCVSEWPENSEREPAGTTTTSNEGKSYELKTLPTRFFLFFLVRGGKGVTNNGRTDLYRAFRHVEQNQT